ncbi:uncharacterized protein BO96DRAFT_433740 [Aspergillus niger CBS 101883]|uniref:Uncharacterized protein n=2 Tax=Aspergillus niger TaxID=5061 RepID=A2R4P0_ASPNC|nr:uncharacterized protein BO96DRAFT_433740 [Aspergillus niger CBS 101883]XP_059602442.1 hypothetical protein An15g01090 [Aspergillus niger]PYH56934.1 hypothetical protein BO96DRAFT_433740 [Aspergillus niger CBS 101883]CAK42278.1 hypothetical protein An15g01090 [Aspergillus niger]
MYAPGTQEFDLSPGLPGHYQNPVRQAGRPAGTACMKPSLLQLPSSSWYRMDWLYIRRANRLRVSWHWVCHCWPTTATGGINVSKPASKSPPACQRGLPDDQNPIRACVELSFDKHPPVRSSTAHPLCRDLTIGPVPYHPKRSKSRARASVGASVGGLAGQREDSSDSQPQQQQQQSPMGFWIFWGSPAKVLATEEKAPLLPSFIPIDHPRGIPAGTLEQRLSARIPTEPDWNRRPAQWKTSNPDIEAALLMGTLAERKVDAAHSPPLGHLVVMRFRLLVTGHHGVSIGLEIGHRCGRDGSLTTKSAGMMMGGDDDNRGHRSFSFTTVHGSRERIREEKGSYCEKARAYGPQSSDRGGWGTGAVAGRAHSRFDV